MAHAPFTLSDKILVVGIFAFIAATLSGVATNCSWWDHAFCDDKATADLVNTGIFASGVLSVLTFLIGGAMREINMEGKLPPPEADNEFRVEYEKQSITRQPFVPNLMIVVGLILAFGIGVTILGTIGSAQYDRDPYRVLNWILFVAGLTTVFSGYYLKRRWAHAPANLDHATTDA